MTGPGAGAARTSPSIAPRRPSAEPYFANFVPREIVAKTGAALAAKDLDRQWEDCRERDRRAARTFSDAARAPIEDAAQRIGAAFAKRWREQIGIEPTRRLVADAPVLKTGGPTRYPTAPAGW